MKKFLPATLWAAFIMFICGVPGQTVPPVYLFTFDQLVHSVIFLILYVLIILPMRSRSILTLRLHVIAGGISLAYAALTEILQAYVFINRSGDLRDFLADAAGIVAGII